MDFVFKLLPFLVRLIGLAEQVFRQPKSGPEKKAFVVDAAKTVVDGIGAVSTGGQAETWGRISQPVDEIIDATADILFPKEKPFPHTDISSQ